MDDDGGSPHFYSLTAFEFFRLFPKAKEFRLSTAIRMNASFPYVSPAVSLPTTPPRRVVDAGYYDNYGIQVAAAWISKNVDELIENTSGVVLVQIRDSVSQLDRLGVNDAPEGFLAAASRSFQFFSSPLDGCRSARSSSGLFRNDQDVEALSRLFIDRLAHRAGEVPPKIVRRHLLWNTNPPASPPAHEAFFTTVVFENAAEVTAPPRTRRCSRGPARWPPRPRAPGFARLVSQPVRAGRPPGFHPHPRRGRDGGRPPGEDSGPQGKGRHDDRPRPDRLASRAREGPELRAIAPAPEVVEESEPLNSPRESAPFVLIKGRH